MTDLPSEIQVWESYPKLHHTGTWSTERYPAEAVAYVRKEDAEAAQALASEAFARVDAMVKDTGEFTERAWADLAAALAPASGVAALAELRAERALLRADRDSAARMWQASEQEREAAVERSREASQMLAIETNHAAQAEAERDDALTRLAAAEAQVGALIGWQPPEDRPDGYRCLGWTDDGWVVVTWVQMGRDPARWFTDWYPERDDIPTAFAPLPAPLASAAGGAK